MSKARIIEAVMNLDPQSTKALLKEKPSLLNVTDRRGRNLLHLACSASCEKLKMPEAASQKRQAIPRSAFNVIPMLG